MLAPIFSITDAPAQLLCNPLCSVITASSLALKEAFKVAKTNMFTYFSFQNFGFNPVQFQFIHEKIIMKFENFLFSFYTDCDAKKKKKSVSKVIHMLLASHRLATPDLE